MKKKDNAYKEWLASKEAQKMAVGMENFIEKTVKKKTILQPY